jgi:O-antigen ligase
MLGKSRKRFKALALSVVVGAGIWFLLPAEQKERFTAMGEDETSMSRIAYWERGLDMMKNNPVTGVGYANWMRYSAVHYPAFINPNNGQPWHQLPHNIFIEAGAELGYTGLLLFVGLIGFTFYTNYRTRKLCKGRPNGVFASAMANGLDAGLVGFLVAGFFVTVLYYPFFWINYALTVALHHVVVSRVAAPQSPPRQLSRP